MPGSTTINPATDGPLQHFVRARLAALLAIHQGVFAYMVAEEDATRGRTKVAGKRAAVRHSR